MHDRDERGAAGDGDHRAAMPTATGCEPDGWKFSEVVLDCQTLSPLDEGWARMPFWSE